MTKRWRQRPPGSTWGDWGDDDELGRINLLTADKVLEGVREVEAGISFCLSLPLDFPGGTALNQRRYPPGLAPTEDMRGNPATFYNVHMSEMEEGGPRFVDVWADDVVTLSLQYSTQWDSLAHVGAEFDADGDGVEEAVYYNGYRAGVDLVGPQPDAAGDGGGPPVLRPPSRPRAHGPPRRPGARRARRPGPPPRATTGAASTGRRSRTSWPATASSVEPGDMLLLHTGFATKVLEWNRHPDPVQIHVMCTYLDARDPSLLEWIADSQISALVADNYAVEGLVGRDRDPEPPLAPPHPPPLPLPAGGPAGRDVVPARAGCMAARARAEPVPAHRTAAPPARCRRVTADPGRHRLRTGPGGRPCSRCGRPRRSP